ncbi:MAG TPA: hypothetical protein VGL70_12555 [Candidatus Binatia bacterium]|jgi:hypothetical protein
MIILIVVIVVGLLFFLPRTRGWILEELKALSDVLVVGSLRLSSRFGSELTSDGKAEQAVWREQRLRNLRGLALRSKEAVGRRPSGLSPDDHEKNRRN